MVVSKHNCVVGLVQTFRVALWQRLNDSECLSVANGGSNPTFRLDFDTKCTRLSVSPGHDATQVNGLASPCASSSGLLVMGVP